MAWKWWSEPVLHPPSQVAQSQAYSNAPPSPTIRQGRLPQSTRLLFQIVIVKSHYLAPHVVMFAINWANHPVILRTPKRPGWLLFLSLPSVSFYPTVSCCMIHGGKRSSLPSAPKWRWSKFISGCCFYNRSSFARLLLSTGCSTIPLIKTDSADGVNSESFSGLRLPLPLSAPFFLLSSATSSTLVTGVGSSVGWSVSYDDREAAVQTRLPYLAMVKRYQAF